MATSIAAVDQQPIALNANEELAGPPIKEVVAPVSQAERINALDVLRGFSLMGILIMNITEFAFGGVNYMVPLSTIKPVFDGPHWKANTILWFARWIFAEGKMRGLFSLLFGAGVVLLTERAERRGAGVKVADVFTRRNMWLVLFGMLHGFLIWEGDILFYYGLAALLFLFPFRNVRPKRLMWVAGILLAVNSLIMVGAMYMRPLEMKKSADKANAKLAQHKALDEKEVGALKEWSSQQEQWRQSEKKKQEATHANQHGWAGAQGHAAGNTLQNEIMGAYFGFGDWVGMMLLGMALYKNGFLPGRQSLKTYAVVAAICLPIAWGVTFLGAFKAWHGHFDMFQSYRWLNFPYDVTRLAGALGNAAMILLVLKSGALKWLTKAVGNVGQMALSNYLLTSLTMQTIYKWGPWHWFNAVDYYKVYIAVACMWTFNMVFSSIWLRIFRFGPMEWVWRSLTYWKKQPMKLHQPEPLVPHGEGAVPAGA